MSPALGGAPGVTSLNSSVHLFGHDFGLWGKVGYFLNSNVYDVGIFTLFLFQLVFMDTTATIPTGSMAERWKFKSFVIYGFFISMFVYPIFGNWVWGGGWLSQLGVNFGLGHGHVDFAGSSVVHEVGGVAALAGAMVIGPRIGKYGKDGSRQCYPRTQYPDGDHRYLHPGLRVVRLQPGLDPRRHRPPDQRSRGQHDAGQRQRRLPRNDLCLVEIRQAGPWDAGQRNAGGFGGHHGSLRLRQRDRSHHHRRASPASW